MSDVVVPPAGEGAQDPAERATWWQLTGCIGCGSMILLMFLLTWLASEVQNQRVLSEPTAVEANLRSMVSAEVPPGYRGFRGFRQPGHAEIERIAVLVPADFSGEDIPVDVPLVISVWRFGPAPGRDARLEEMVRFWTETASKRHGEQPVEVSSARPTTVSLGGEPVPAEERSLTVGAVELKLVTALVADPTPATATDAAPKAATVPGLSGLGLAFVGRAESFDRAALERFVASIGHRPREPGLRSRPAPRARELPVTLARRLRVDLAGVLGTTGVILVVMGLAQLLPAATALALPESRALPLFLGAIGTALVGLLLLPLRSQSGRWTRRESLAIVAVTWLAAIAAGAVPFVVTGATGVVSGLYESASGLTTTGATVLPDVDGIPPPLHLWRALSHWMGGAGIVLVVLVITPWLGNAEELRRTQRSEASFLTERYRGSTRATLRALLAVYVGATAVHTGLLVLLGVSPWDAVLHAFSTVATGGFSTRTASLGAWGTAVQLVTVVFMLLGAISFVSMGRAITGGGVRVLLQNGEVRGYLLMIALVSLFMALVLVGWGDGARYGLGLSGVWQALVDALVTVTSISSTTGFTTVNYALWPAPCQVILVVLMLVGGCSGSTAGGIKFFRVQIVVKHTYRELLTLANPGAVIPIRLGDRVIEEHEVRGALSYVTLYGVLILVVAVAIALTGSDPVTAGAASVSSFGSVGPGFGQIDPMGSFQPLHPLAKLLCVFAMILGRLEILPLLAASLPSFWLHRARRGWRASA